MAQATRLFLIVLLVAPATHAAVFTVDRFDDSTPIASACTAAPNDCSLRGAVQAANTNPGGDTIVVPPGVYALTRAGSGDDGNSTGDLDLDISDQWLSIVGDAADPPVIQQTTDDRVLHILHPGAGPAVLRDLVLSGGTSDFGGALHSAGGTLTIERVVFRSNSAGSGGCLHRSGSNALTITDSVFEQCTANGVSGIGGALSLSIPQSPFHAVITGSRFVENAAKSGGGAIRVGGDNFLYIADTVFIGNKASDPGGSSSGGSITVFGPVDLLAERVAIVDSAAGSATNTFASGGALAISDGHVSLVNVTISRASVEGANPRAAAILVTDGELDLEHVTITDSRTSGEHAIFVDGNSTPATVSFDASIIDGGCASAGSVTLTSGHYNVEVPWDGTTTSTCGLSAGDVVTQDDLRLRPSAVYGGPFGVWTQALLPGPPFSPAAFLVPSSQCAGQTDARGVLRGGLFCTAGAHEDVPYPPGTDPVWLFADGFDSGDTGAWDTP